MDDHASAVLCQPITVDSVFAFLYDLEVGACSREKPPFRLFEFVSAISCLCLLLDKLTTILCSGNEFLLLQFLLYLFVVYHQGLVYHHQTSTVYADLFGQLGKIVDETRISYTFLTIIQILKVYLTNLNEIAHSPVVI